MESQLFQKQRLRVEKRIEDACREASRNPEEVTLMAVTKTHGPEIVDLAFAEGIEVVGENRVQEAESKKKQVSKEGPWELIGPLQSNKARLAVQLFDRIQTVDRPKIVRVLDRICEEEGRSRLPILMQVNAGRDPAKSGVELEGAEALAKQILESDHLQLDGLMTIAPLSDDPEVARNCFRNLKGLQKELEEKLSISLPVLSMGMTGDLEIAIEEGSTLIRVGSALFGQR